MSKVLYFSGTTQLDVVAPMPTKEFTAAFGDAHAKRYDGFNKLVGFVGKLDTYNHEKKCWNRSAFVDAMPVTRVIFRKANPSNHKCGARCRHAKGGQCECECGGKYHGAGNG